MNTKRFHAVRITSRGYQLLDSHATKTDALRAITARDCRIGAVILRDGTTGNRYTYAECVEMMKSA